MASKHLYPPLTVAQKKGILNVSYSGILFVLGITASAAYVDQWLGSSSFWSLVFGVLLLAAAIILALKGVLLLMKGPV